MVRKKIILFLSVVFTLLFLSSYAYAENQYYDLEPLGIRIALPGETIVFTQDMTEDELNLDIVDMLGKSWEELLEQYKANNIYLDAIAGDFAYEILVIAMSDEAFQKIGSLSDFTEKEIAGFLAATEESYRDLYPDMVFQVCDMLEQSKIKFIKIYTEFPYALDASTSLYDFQYITIYNGQYLAVSAQSGYKTNITENEELFDAIVASIIPLDTVTGVVSNENDQYKNEEAGVSFTIPAGWEQKELSQERQHIRAKYINHEGNSLLFGYTDLWEALSDEEKAGHKRSDVNNNLYTPEEVGEFFFTTDNDTVVESDYHTIGNIEYFRLVREIKADGIEMRMISHFLFYNGLMYEFSFGGFPGDEKTAAYQDYEAWLSTVQYDQFIATPYAVKDQLGLPINSSDSTVGWAILLNLLLTLVIYLVPMLIYRFGVKKEPLPMKKALKITVIYSICVVLVLSLLNGEFGGLGPAVLWGCVNHTILTKGRKKKSEQRDKIENGEERVGHMVDEEENDTKAGNSEEDTRELLAKRKDITGEEAGSFEFASNEEVLSYDRIPDEDSSPQMAEMGEAKEANGDLQRADNIIQNSCKEENEITLSVDKIAYLGQANAENVESQVEKPVAPSFCRFCGAVLFPDSHFCNQCGQSVKRQEKKK